ncbi:MAG: hypothetical protein ABIV48_14070, partial [Pyrinomonadaceae bacterium]
MRVFALFLILFGCLNVFGQSGRVTADAKSGSAAAAQEISVKAMFDETNGYIRAKGEEFDAKKIQFSDRLFTQAKLEQRQMAARFAAGASARVNLAEEDFYYLGMLHWIAENNDGTVDALSKFIASESDDAARRQTARSIVVVVLAKQRKLKEGEALLAEYLKSGPTRLTEKARMQGELAKAYQTKKDYIKMAPHAEEGYLSSKQLLSDSSSRARGLDEILDAGMLVYEAYRDLGDQKKAEAALDDMRATAITYDSPSFYYYAVDQKIKYLIDTGRKIQALDFYQASLSNAGKDFTAKASQTDILSRLKKREKHYKLLGD